MLSKWNTQAKVGIEIVRGTFINTILFDDNQVLIVETEDKFHYNIHKLSIKLMIAKPYDCTTVISKTDTMTFRG